MKQFHIAKCAAFSVAVLGLLSGTAHAQTKVKTKSSSARKTKTAAGPARGAGELVAKMDRTVLPCDDFFRHASGTWLKNNPIPAAEPSWGVKSKMARDNKAVMRRILEQAAADRTAAPGSNRQKVGDFYAAFMDTAAIERAGLQYLQPRLAKINGIQDLAGLQAYLADPKGFYRGWYSFFVYPDAKNSSQYAVQLGQGGLGLPDRDNYLQDDARSKAIRAAYRTYQVNLFKLLGDDPATAEQNAAAVTRLETRLAKASRDRVALRDPERNYHKVSVAQATADYPNLNLPLRLQQGGLGAAQTVIVRQPDFLREVNAMLTEEPLADHKQYLRWKYVTDVIPYLPRAFGDETLRFVRVTAGTQQLQPRWQRAVATTDGHLGEAFGQLYVAEVFPPAAKARVEALVETIRLTYAENIQASTWMSAATKAEALKKLAAIGVKIGYPDRWEDYSAVAISRESALNNSQAVSDWGYAKTFRKLGQPIDRNEWGMTPPTVNAYYNAVMNEIVLPAGILQPTYFDPAADDAVNYGGIGFIIGHEIMHAFDDQGRRYDAQGNLRDWWTPEDAARFKAQAAVVGRQFDAFPVLDSLRVNGQLTMGENLADFGGLVIAYRAFMKTPQAKAGKPIDGFTPEQRFFLAYAQGWRGSRRPESLRLLVQTDPHAPSWYRTNGPLQNMPEFQAAFACKASDQMVRPAAVRAKIW